MKSTVWHLIGDKRAGGSNRLVQQLIDSRLEKEFDFFVFRLEEAKAKLKTSAPDVIIFHYPCAWKYLLDLLLLKQHSKVYIYDHHYCQGFEQHQVSSKLRFRLMLRLAYGLADGVISVSSAQRDWMTENKLVNPHKIRTIFSASPIDALLRIPPKSLSHPLQIGAYGRFAPQKGFDLLLSAFASLPPDQFQLSLGGYGQDEKKIADLAEDLPHVKLLGAIKDVPAFLASCDIIIIPSRWEPWGLVCLEAKAAGKPVVVFAVDGLKEQVRDCGLLVTPNDANKLAEAIASLAEKPLNQWGEVGRQSVIHCWDDFLNSWSAFLQEAVA